MDINMKFISLISGLCGCYYSISVPVWRGNRRLRFTTSHELSIQSLFLDLIMLTLVFGPWGKPSFCGSLWCSPLCSGLTLKIFFLILKCWNLSFNYCKSINTLKWLLSKMSCFVIWEVFEHLFLQVATCKSPWFGVNG